MRVSAWVRSAVASSLGRSLGYGLIAGLAVTAAGAQAQQAPAAAQPASDNSGGGLQEVVVTAERRSENVQNVPIAISAFTAESLQTHNLADVQNLGNMSPGVNLDAGAPFSGDRSVLSASIRGVGQDDFAFNMNPAVGVYLDGVYLARTIGANQNLLDVDRVEILKGPQGTLFGANTEGGAISIVTHTPGNEFKVTGQITGGSYDRRDVGFTADIPIIANTLLSTITVSSQNRNGYVKVVPYPSDTAMGSESYVVDSQTAYPKAGYETNDNYGGYGVTTMRGKLLWNASDKDTVTFTGDWNHQAQTALPYQVLGTYTGNLGTSTFSTLYDLCISNTASTINAAIAAAGGPPAGDPTTPGIPAGLAAAYKANQAFAAYCSRPRASVPGLSTGGAPLLGSGYVGNPALSGLPAGSYQTSLNASLLGTSAYQGSNSPRLYLDGQAEGATNNPYGDTTYANGPDFANNDYFGFAVTEQHQFNDDLSLKSISAYRQIVWQIGTDLDGSPETWQEVSDHQHQWQVSQEFQLNGKALDGNLNYVGGLYYFEEAGYVHDYVPFEGLLYVYDFANDVNNKNEAAFIHADYKLGNFGFTAGGRYTDVQEEFIGGQGDLNGFAPGAGPASTGYALPAGTVVHYFPPGDNHQSWKVFDPTVGAQYHFTDDVMTYLSWGKGFKAGGWTTRLSAVVPAAYEYQTQYSPEYTKTWELGLKSSWLNHHLQADAAVFYTDYDSIQLNVQQGISPVYMNAGNAKIKGAELELKAVVGGGLSFDVSGSYIDAYYTYVNPNSAIPQYALADGTVVDGVPGVAGYNPLAAKLPKTPKYKMTLGPQYDFMLPNQATIRFVADYTLMAGMFNDSLNTPQLYRPASHMLNAAVHFISPNELYDLAVGGTNLTDDRFITGGSPNYGAGEVGGYVNEPREWYVQLTAKFK